MYVWHVLLSTVRYGTKVHLFDFGVLMEVESNSMSGPRSFPLHREVEVWNECLHLRSLIDYLLHLFPQPTSIQIVIVTMI